MRAMIGYSLAVKGVPLCLFKIQTIQLALFHYLGVSLELIIYTHNGPMSELSSLNSISSPFTAPSSVKLSKWSSFNMSESVSPVQLTTIWFLVCSYLTTSSS